MAKAKKVAVPKVKAPPKAPPMTVRVVRTQFTNKPKPAKNWPGTYSYTYRECRTRNGGAVLTEDFMEGTRDPVNAVKAAICLLDLENASLPTEARQEFLREPKSGSVYMLTAFNAGSGWSRRLFEKVRTFREKFRWGHVPLEYDVLPKSFFMSNNFYNEESHLYIKKYLLLWKLLYPEKLATVPVPTLLSTEP